MPKPTYTPTTWVNNTTPALSADNLNHIESGLSATTAYAATSVQSVTAGTNVTVDNTDPANPIITATGGSGSGTVDSIGASDSTITVDDTDPANPKIKVTGSTFAPVTTGTSILKGNGSGGTAAATAGTDYVAPSGSITGNAATATKLATARTIALTGKITGSATFDGSGDASIATSSALAAADVSGLATVATSGSYTDLSNTPSIPATAADVGAAPMVVASGASAVRFTGTGTSLPSSGQQTGDVFFLTS